MSELTQMQDTTGQIAGQFDAGAFGQLKDQRQKAISLFRKLGLPTTKSEEYKFTPITKLLEKHFNIDDLGHHVPDDVRDIDNLLIPGLEDNRIVFVNGRYSDALTNVADTSITFCTLEKALDLHGDIVMKHLHEHADSGDPFAQLNNAMWQEGLFLHVKKGVTGQKPLVLHYIHDAREEQVSTQTRLMVVVEESASLSMIEKHDSLGSKPVFNNAVEEIIVGENASLTYCKIQNDAGNFHTVVNTVLHQSNSSRINTYTFTLDGKLVRNNLHILVDGEGCESHFYGLYLLDKDTLADNHTVVDHRKPNSFSNELYKGVMDGKAKGVFNGKIYVRPHAQKTNAFQSNRNIILSDSASVNTKPQLEIWADDVKCSHGCTSGQLDDEALFYIQTRGIPLETARAMLLYAFAGEVIETISNEHLKNYIDTLISQRLNRIF